MPKNQQWLLIFTSFMINIITSHFMLHSATDTYCKMIIYITLITQTGFLMLLCPQRKNKTASCNSSDSVWSTME
jgi:hypothetical protein